MLKITVFQIGLAKKLHGCGYVCYDFFSRPDLVPNTVRYVGLAGVSQRKLEKFAK